MVCDSKVQFTLSMLHQRFGLVLEAIQLREFGINAAPFICLALLPRPPLRSACGLRPRDAPLFRPRLRSSLQLPSAPQNLTILNIF